MTHFDAETKFNVFTYRHIIMQLKIYYISNVKFSMFAVQSALFIRQQDSNSNGLYPVFRGSTRKENFNKNNKHRILRILTV